MGLFDKLKSLVSDDKKDTGTIEIVAPLSGEIVNIEDVPDVVFAEKSLATVSPSNRPATKWLLRLTAPSVRFSKPTMHSLSNPTAALSCSSTSASIP